MKMQKVGVLSIPCSVLVGDAPGFAEKMFRKAGMKTAFLPSLNHIENVKKKQQQTMHKGLQEKPFNGKFLDWHLGSSAIKRTVHGDFHIM